MFQPPGRAGGFFYQPADDLLPNQWSTTASCGVLQQAAVDRWFSPSLFQPFPASVFPAQPTAPVEFYILSLILSFEFRFWEFEVIHDECLYAVLASVGMPVVGIVAEVQDCTTSVAREVIFHFGQ